MPRNDSWLPRERMSGRGGYHRRDRSSGLRRAATVLLAIVIVALIGSAVQLLRKPPLPTARISMPTSSVIPGSLPALPWPSQGSADVGVLGIGSTGNHGQATPIGLASVAKMVSALVIVHDHPLAPGKSGPIITVTAADAANYQSMLAAQDSVMVVAQGEQLSEYQALEAMLIPSADNVATLMAQWDAGSVSAFVAKMNAMAKSLGMTHTIYKDPSGLDSGTAGTAPDQLKAEAAVLANPVLAQIVAMPQATLPIAGVVYNVNGLVGHDGITGVKTGSTPAGGNFAFSGTVSLPSSSALPSSITSNPSVIGVILGQQGYTPLPTALAAGKTLLNAFRSVPKLYPVLKAGQTVAVVSAPGQAPVDAVTASGAEMVAWPGLKVSYRLELAPKLPASFPAGYRIGSLVVTLGQERAVVPVTASSAVTAPGLGWKLRRL